MAEFNPNSSVDLYYNNSKKLETTSSGIQIDGSDGVAISSGAISIKNGGTQSYIDLYCESSNAHYARLQSPAHSDFSGNITSTLPNTTGTLVTSNAQRRIEVVSSLPGSPDSNTIYFVT